MRTLDVGADKPLAAVPMAPEANPFLGRRGLRLSLARPELLSVQLRAILRVAAEHPLKVMFPMVSVAAELDAALELLEAARVADRDHRRARGGDHGRGAVRRAAG